MKESLREAVKVRAAPGKREAQNVIEVRQVRVACETAVSQSRMDRRLQVLLTGVSQT